MHWWKLVGATVGVVVVLTACGPGKDAPPEVADPVEHVDAELLAFCEEATSCAAEVDVTVSTDTCLARNETAESLAYDAACGDEWLGYEKCRSQSACSDGYYGPSTVCEVDDAALLECLWGGDSGRDGFLAAAYFVCEMAERCGALGNQVNILAFNDASGSIHDFDSCRQALMESFEEREPYNCSGRVGDYLECLLGPGMLTCSDGQLMGPHAAYWCLEPSRWCY